MLLDKLNYIPEGCRAGLALVVKAWWGTLAVVAMELVAYWVLVAMVWVAYLAWVAFAGVATAWVANLVLACLVAHWDTCLVELALVLAAWGAYK